MNRVILVFNAGSSSIKYRLVDVRSGGAVCSGVVERIGTAEVVLRHTTGGLTSTYTGKMVDHRSAMRQIARSFDLVGPDLSNGDLLAVGHRVVMGGAAISAPVIIDDNLLASLDRLSSLAPLHNPPAIDVISVARELFGGTPHVAVADTAFFRTLPAAATTYAIARDVAVEFGVRRYGFHGISHEYVAAQVAGMMDPVQTELRQIILHLGNGASASAILGDTPIDSSMGLTPLEGLVMGTRCGDLDPAVVVHLVRNGGMSADAIDELLNHRSGMLGMTGEADMRDVHRLIAQGDASARLGLDVYVRRIKKYIGAYIAVLGGLDALTFTAGVGENDAIVRAAVVEGLGVLGLEIDPVLNTSSSTASRVISPEGARVRIFVIPTDEESAIARQVALSLLDH